MTVLHTNPAGHFQKSKELIGANTITVTDRNLVIHIWVFGTI
jgi:hypothetical protein